MFLKQLSFTYRCFAQIVALLRKGKFEHIIKSKPQNYVQTYEESIIIQNCEIIKFYHLSHLVNITIYEWSVKQLYPHSYKLTHF